MPKRNKKRNILHPSGEPNFQHVPTTDHTNICWLDVLLEELPRHEGNILFMNGPKLDLMHHKLEEVISSLEKLRDKVQTLLLHRRDISPQYEIEESWSNFILNLIGIAQQDDTLIKYDTSIELRLYPPHILERVRGIEGYNTFSVRLKKDNMVECLLCNYKVSQTKIARLWDHVTGKSHMALLELHYQNLKKYHQFWMNQYPRDQEIQLIYHYFNDKMMKCIKCMNIMPYDDVFPHLDNCTRRYRRANIIDESIDQPSGKLPYTRQTRRVLFRDMPVLYIDDIECPVMQRVEKTIICLICNILVTEYYHAHCDNMYHLYYQSYYTNTETLKNYHIIWSSLSDSKQIQQMYFSREDSDMYCRICKTLIPYDTAQVEEHIDSVEHVQNIEQSKENEVVDSSKGNEKQGNVFEEAAQKQIPNEKTAVKENNAVDAMITDGKQRNIRKKASQEQIPNDKIAVKENDAVDTSMADEQENLCISVVSPEHIPNKKNSVKENDAVDSLIDHKEQDNLFEEQSELQIPNEQVAVIENYAVGTLTDDEELENLSEETPQEETSTEKNADMADDDHLLVETGTM